MICLIVVEDSIKSFRRVIQNILYIKDRDLLKH